MKLTNNMNELEQSKTLEDLNDDLLALKMRIAFQADFEDELDALQNQEPDDALNQAMDEAAPRIYRLFEKEVRRARSRRIVRQYMPKLCRACAVVLLVFYLGLTVAVATMEPVREGMLDFIQDITDKYTRFDIEPDEVEIPPEWEGEYYPTYIPKGLDVVYADADTVWLGEDWSITFVECDEVVDLNFDTENANNETIMIGPSMAVISTKDDWVTIVKEVGDKYIYVSVNGSKDKAIRIAESIKKIEKTQ